MYSHRTKILSKIVLRNSSSFVWMRKLPQELIVWGVVLTEEVIGPYIHESAVTLRTVVLPNNVEWFFILFFCLRLTLPISLAEGRYTCQKTRA